jgi:F-type H+-transporting ATPase subunit alpha
MSKFSKLKPEEISSIIADKISGVSEGNLTSEGTIISVKDGIVNIHGLTDVKSNEVIEFSNGTKGLALNLEQDIVGAVVLGDYYDLQEGDTVKCTGDLLKVPVGEALLGRIVNALGEPIDGGDKINAQSYDYIEKPAPGVIDRQSVDTPLQTGIKAVDTMVPIGKGQRELIVGDRQTGKTAIAIDTIINQKGKNVKCVYVAIGQKSSSVASVVSKLAAHDALSYTTIVVASASDSAALQYIAPYSGCTIAEYYRDKGEDALIIYDDLTKQAWAYRQISLLLKRPPGREAYPGDVFYLHSRLLERASNVTKDYVKKISGVDSVGSLTALPIIETQAGDLSAFVVTNVISITDGQIFLDSNLFNSGNRPAINAGLSVSRVGGAAQTSLIKKLGGGIRIALAQYRELEAFAQFASDLDVTTKSQLNRGARITNILKQPQYNPLSQAEMAVSTYIVNEGLLDDVAASQVQAFEKTFLKHLNDNHKEILSELNKGEYNEDILKSLADVVVSFKETFGWSSKSENV